jgi:hypothetical protein
MDRLVAVRDYATDKDQEGLQEATGATRHPYTCQ